MSAAPKRLDEDNLGFLIVVGRALRAVDDNLAPID